MNRVEWSLSRTQTLKKYLQLLLPSKNENFRLIYKHWDFCKERCGFSSTIPWLNYEWFFRSWEATQRLDGLKCQVEAIFQIFCRFELDTPLCVITLGTLIDKPNKKVSFLMHTNINEWSKIRCSIEIGLQISKMRLFSPYIWPLWMYALGNA